MPSAHAHNGLRKPSQSSLQEDRAHGALANEAKVLRVVGRQLAVGRVEATGHHVPVTLVALAIGAALGAGPLVPCL